ncbi:hypothetical protein PLEOSDRAFT_1102594 [Pleurotus ostreatus PC15]|uniref:Uncharacterized protein n=1 Tax=Pleurotus ostreatus (strain PC15) TaxID=1137138 RepID=A0A067NWM6_PLEO1|nr:hypothetical protein PLEOSDRAFT_1102594 [Pleurotus ostreatus PC15]
MTMKQQQREASRAEDHGCLARTASFASFADGRTADTRRAAAIAYAAVHSSSTHYHVIVVVVPLRTKGLQYAKPISKPSPSYFPALLVIAATPRLSRTRIEL